MFVLQEPLIIASLDNIHMLAQYTRFSLIMHTNLLRHAMNNRQLVLKWHYHEATVTQNLPYFLENDIFCDVTISVGAQNIKAHKIMLAMCSVYFFQLFQQMKTSQHPVIVLHNASIEDVKAMLAFIYRGQCVVSKNQLPNLLSIAKLLKIQGLCDMKMPERHVPDITIPLAELQDSHRTKTKMETSVSGTYCDVMYSNGVRSSSSTREKHLRDATDNTIICSSENAIPIMSTKKKEIIPKDSTENCKCFLCGKYLSNQYNLRVHMETHEECYHACHSCTHISRSRDALRKHVSYRHPDENPTKKRKIDKELLKI